MYRVGHILRHTVYSRTSRYSSLHRRPFWDVQVLRCTNCPLAAAGTPDRVGSPPMKGGRHSGVEERGPVTQNEPSTHREEKRAHWDGDEAVNDKLIFCDGPWKTGLVLQKVGRPNPRWAGPAH